MNRPPFTWSLLAVLATLVVSLLAAAPGAIFDAGAEGPGGTADLALPAPVLARQVNVKLVSGRVRIKQPGQRSFRPLLGEDQIRVGSQVDATQGRVRLTTTAGKGKTQTADFFEGVFKILQSRGTLPVTELRLTGRLTNCGGRSSATSGPRAGAAARVKGRRLWGSGKGRFRTRGKRSAATVRGTIWRVDDRCNDTTWTVVRKGVVSVRDFGLRRSITLRPGRTYVARPRGG